MLHGDMYMAVANNCPAYNALFEAVKEHVDLVSCTTCENFKNGFCSVDYYDVIAMNIATDNRRLQE